ncbi:MAG: hypothetical protein VYC15_00595 [Pseudomonadota bacterium]|nr:hypothetical protein [Pseudomonadota bacterium]
MNLFKVTIIPMGIAIKEAIIIEEKETFKDVITTLKSEASKLKMRLKDEIIASKKNPVLVDSASFITGKTISSFAKT